MHPAMSCMGCTANSFSTADLQPPFAVDGVLGLHESLFMGTIQKPRINFARYEPGIGTQLISIVFEQPRNQFGSGLRFTHIVLALLT